MINIKSVFPTNENEKELVQFISKYKYLPLKDVKFFFEDTSYYPKRIARLIQNRIIRKYNGALVLAEDGYNYLRVIGKPIQKFSYHKKYADRLKYIAHIAATYYKEPRVAFSPSYIVKDKEVYTETSRKYIGVLTIFGIKYLIYHISKEHSDKYINSVIYDLQKETQYKNAIILINDLTRINIKDFAFGLNSVIVCDDKAETLDKLKYMHQVDWHKVTSNLYNNKVYASQYSFCEYTDNKEKFITTFFLVDAEKINRIDTFLKANPNKNADIICDKSIVHLLGKEIPTVNYKLINISELIERNIKLYG